MCSSGDNHHQKPGTLGLIGQIFTQPPREAEYSRDPNVFIVPRHIFCSISFLLIETLFKPEWAFQLSVGLMAFSNTNILMVASCILHLRLFCKCSLASYNSRVILFTGQKNLQLFFHLTANITLKICKYKCSLLPSNLHRAINQRQTRCFLCWSRIFSWSDPFLWGGGDWGSSGDFNWNLSHL